jgi:hypothetical protein
MFDVYTRTVDLYPHPWGPREFAQLNVGEAQSSYFAGQKYDVVDDDRRAYGSERVIYIRRALAGPAGKGVRV